MRVETGGNMNIENTENENVIKGSRKGRKENIKNHQEVEIEQQSKFFIDLRKDSENLEMILNVLKEANNKDYGREIILKDLVLAAVPKLTTKDVERIQEQSLTEMERVQRHLDDYNQKNNTKLALGEFLVKKFNL